MTENGFTPVSHSELLGVLSYEPETGQFSWNVQRAGMKVGDVAGYTTPQGYICITIRRRNYMAHRLAWMYMTGKWPREQIDHINGTKGDNRFANLREATHAENQRNAGPNRNNKSGRKGVSWNRQNRKWHAQIKRNGKTHHLGVFDNVEDAAEAYRSAALELHREFARTDAENPPSNLRNT